MRVVIQRVNHASCEIDKKIVSKIDNGYMILVGFTNGDREEIVDKICNKIIKLRVFSDDNGKMNLAIKDVNGSILSISQFTLYADTKTGNRPSFINALNPKDATILYDYFNNKLRSLDVPVYEGVFGADMKIDLENDGPVTIVMEEN